MEEFKVGQLTKVLVLERLRKLDDRCAATGQIVKQVLLVALKRAEPADPSWKNVVRDACQGAVMAAVLCELDVSKAAIELLISTGEAAYDLGLQSEWARDGALCGIADARRFVSADKLLELHAEIARRFPKAGREFSNLLYADLLGDPRAVGPTGP